MKTWLHILLLWSADTEKVVTITGNFGLYSSHSNDVCTEACKRYLALHGGADHYVQMRRPVLTTKLSTPYRRQKYRPLTSSMLTQQPFTLKLSRSHGQPPA